MKIFLAGCTLLPVDVAEIIVKVPPGKRYGFHHIKCVLLKRFLLETEVFKNKFENHQIKTGALLSELVYELRVYLYNCSETVKVKDYESLNELMLTEHVKRNIPFEIEDKFWDEWDEIKTASYLVENSDKYEGGG